MTVLGKTQYNLLMTPQYVTSASSKERLLLSLASQTLDEQAQRSGQTVLKFQFLSGLLPL